MTETATTAPPHDSRLSSLKAKVETVRDLILKNRQQIEMALPKHLNADRMIRVALTSISTTPALLECTPRSLLGAIIQCAQLGLEPGILGHAYLVPFKNRKAGTVEVQLIPGYKGLLALCRRSGEISTIDAQVVRKGDTFSFARGLKPVLDHVPSEDPKRHEQEITRFYAVIRLKDGGVQFDVMTKAEVDDHRDRYSKAAKDGPWVTNYPEMGLKTVLRRASKFAPMSIETEKAIALDEHAEAQLPQHLGDIVAGLDEPTNGQKAGAGEAKSSKLDELTKTITTPATQAADGAADPRATALAEIAALVERSKVTEQYLASLVEKHVGRKDYAAEDVSVEQLCELKAALEWTAKQIQAGNGREKK